MEKVELAAGVIDYLDTGGDGPVVVLIGGIVMNKTLWQGVVAQLRGRHRCLVPVLPLGGHRRPMRPDADLSLHGQAELVAEFLDRLGLDDVILVGSDWGGTQLTATRHPERVAALVVLPQEAFGNIPPGLPGRFAGMAGRMPGGVFLAAQAMRLPGAGRLPMTFGWMAKRPIPRRVLLEWSEGLRRSADVRRDLQRYVRSTDYEGLHEAARDLASFHRPVSVLWAAEDRVMPADHGRRLASIAPDGTYDEVDDAYSLLPMDRPDAVAAHINELRLRLPSQSPQVDRAAGSVRPSRRP